MKQIKSTPKYILWEGSIGDYIVYQITDKTGKESQIFTSEELNNLCSLDSVGFDFECEQMMKIDNFHIEREFKKAD